MKSFCLKMQQSCLNTVILTSLIFQLSICFETDRQHRFNQNSDFLLHEANGPLQHQQEINQNAQLAQGKRDYVAPSTSPRPLSSTSVTSPKDQHIPNSQGVHTSSGKRDYVAPSTSPRGPLVTSQQATVKPPYTPPRRDFVNPRFTTAKPLSADNQPKGPGNVHDLVNFFDNKNSNGVNTPKPPSYSSILQGTTKQGSTSTVSGITKTPVTQAPQHISQAQTTKSYSSIVSGSNKHTTTKPSTRPPHVTKAPSPQLPSAIIDNNNRGSSSNSPSDVELQTVSEELLRKDVNNAAKYITVNYQQKTTSQSKEDKAPLPLLTVTPAVWNTPTIQKFIPLLDNYEKDTLVNEYVTPQEKNEENAFMDAIMSTAVIRHLMSFLKDKGYVTPDPRQQREFLKQLWFGLYSRGKGKISSSGFEHIFVSELKNGEVLGLHNWIFFTKEESANRVNYLGYLKYVTFGDKGAVMKLHFSQNGVDKPVDTMFIGTSPELEIALYTLCFVTRADNDCQLKLGNKDVNVISHTFRYRSKNHIGSAYPQI